MFTACIVYTMVVETNNNLRRESTIWDLKTCRGKWNVGSQMSTYTQNCINVWKCIGKEFRTYVYISGVSTVLNWKQG